MKLTSAMGHHARQYIRGSMRRTVQKSLPEGHSGGEEEPTSRLTAPMIPRKMTLPKE